MYVCMYEKEPYGNYVLKRDARLLKLGADVCVYICMKKSLTGIMSLKDMLIF